MARRRLNDRRSEEEVPKARITRENFKQALEIFSFIRPYRWYFIFGLVFLLLSTGTTFGFISLLKELIDPAVEQVDGWEEKLQQVALLLGGILVAQAFFSFMRIYTFAQVSERAMADIRLAIYRKLVVLPIPFFEKRRVGELTSRITSDVQQLQSALSVTLAEFLRQVFTFIIGTSILFSVSWKLTLVMLSTFPPTIIIAMVIGRKIRRLGRESQDALADANVVVEETLQSIHTVKAFANELFEIGRYTRDLRRVVSAALKAANARGFFVVFLITAVFGGITLVIWYGASLIGSGTLTIGTLVYFVMITLFIGGSIAGLGDLYGQLQKTLGASERIRGILREGGEFSLEESVSMDFERVNGDIRFEHVSFTYPTRPDIEVLHDINLRVRPGEKVALVGPSGAGKSTITQLILQYYRLEAGTIYIDDQPAEAYSLPQLRRNIGIVPQEVLLFGGSIRENIAYGKPEATDEEIIDAAHKANAWEFISAFPEKLDTLVGDRGIKLSGGQRQRIAIARAILEDPAILILDEATSSLDAESESLVQEALNLLMEGRSTIVIAHRLSTIRKVDRIYVLEGGRIIEEGSHQQLADQADGLYANLLRLQFAQ